jgi:hypothetical protein
MQGKETDEKSQGYNHEERQAGHPGRLSDLWNQDV